MSYQSLIDDALARARARTGVSVPSVKTANAPALNEEAEKIANALEYLAYAAADDGSAAGTARAELVRDFFKSANEGGAQPTVTSTDAKGTQAIAPQAGKTKLMSPGLTGGNAPAQTAAPDGKMSRNVLEQTPPANPGKSANASLYDLLMAQKVANEGGAMPRQMDASQPAPAYPMGQEGGHAASPLSSTQALVNAKQKDLRNPTRSRLSEIFSHTGDTAVAAATAQAVAPQAVAANGLKTASLLQLAVAFQKEGAGAPGMPMGAPAPSPSPMPQAPAGGGGGGGGEDVQMLIQAAMQGDPRAAQMLAQMGITPESVMAQMQGGAPRPAAPPMAAAPMAAPAAAAGAPMMAPKAASAPGLLEYVELWDTAFGGGLGEHVQAAAQGIVESFS